MVDIMSRLGIWEHIRSRGGLDANLKAMNLSQGEKQLMSLARAMVHHRHTNSKIALMDEVTSQIDYDRDRRVQVVLAEVFSDCTMLVIAHREETVQNMDITLDMAAGRVVMVANRQKPIDRPSSQASATSDLSATDRRHDS